MTCNADGEVLNHDDIFDFPLNINIDLDINLHTDIDNSRTIAFIWK